MNIAILSSGYLLNRKEATWLTLTSLAKELQNQGHQVAVYARKHHSLPAEEIVEGIKIYRLYGNKIIGPYKTLREISTKENSAPDLIHSFSSSPLAVVSTLLAQRRFPLAKAVHSIKSYSVQSFSSIF